MSRTFQILQRTLPILLSVVLIRWIIVSGPHLRIWLDDFFKDTFQIVLDNWELDHAVFGFSLGSPLMLFTFLLLVMKQFHLLRLLIVVALFYLLQTLCVFILAAISVDSFTLEAFDTTYIIIPDIWFWNSTLLISSIISFLTLATTLFLLREGNQQEGLKTLD